MTWQAHRRSNGSNGGAGRIPLRRERHTREGVVTWQRLRTGGRNGSNGGAGRIA